ncbi:hypothetical protein KLL39_05205 [Clostridioides difficile]|nr:flavodoxin domain-containing protein [Clostridioides difficile]MDN9434821.1 hypothetical protein [Clostridioides difficile]
MKTLIVYATKYGCTKKCAEILKSYLKGEVDILSAKSSKINMAQYDNVIVGGSVYMGKMRKEITQFCKHNIKQLLRKKLGLFACCYTPNGTEGFFESLFPLELLNHASYTTTVGGEMDYEKMNFIYRKMFQSLKKIDGFNEGFTEPKINKDEIKKLAEVICR